MNVPKWIDDVLHNWKLCEFTSVSKDSPVSYPVGPFFYEKEQGRIIVATAVAYGKKVENLKKNPRVSMLFSNPTGCRLDYTPVVLVQGTAKVDDRDFVANFRFLEKFIPEFVRKQPSGAGIVGPGIRAWFMRKLFEWYLYRIIIEVTPETILAWKNGDLDSDPERVEVTG